MGSAEKSPSAKGPKERQSTLGSTVDVVSAGWESRGDGPTSHDDGVDVSATSSSMSTPSAPTKRVVLSVKGDELECPDIAWPTLALLLVSLFGYVLPALLTFRRPGWSAVPIMALCNYLLFTPMHDAAHRHVSAACYQAPFLAFRYIHLEHHRHTNDEDRDPDMWATGSGNPWTLPFYWVTLEYSDYAFYLRRLTQWEAVTSFALGLVLFPALLATAAYNGYHKQVFEPYVRVLFFVILPKVLANLFLAYSFAYAPHKPHDTLRGEDIYKCTAMLAGLLTPEDGVDLTVPLLCQNFHNVHHLYPSIPFYRYCLVWARHKPTLLQLGTPISSWWGLGKISKQARDDLRARRRRQRQK